MARRSNGEGSISRHKKSGLYMARYYVETPKGPKRKTIYGKTRDKVAEKLAKALADRADGIVYDDENMTVGEYRTSGSRVPCGVRCGRALSTATSLPPEVSGPITGWCSPPRPARS